MVVIEMNYRSMTAPVGIVRFFEIFLSCTAFSLAAYVRAYGGNYGAWCMFTWCFVFVVSVLILIMELTGVCKKLPISWDDFTSAFSMLAALMILTTSIIYPIKFLSDMSGTHGVKYTYIASATAMSCLCFVAYTIEIGLTRAKPGELTGLMATVPGHLKVLEAYVACIIFVSVDEGHLYAVNAGRQWSMAVYCLCFIVTLLIIILSIGNLIHSMPFPFEKFLVGYNIAAVLLYVVNAIVWPIFSFDKKLGGNQRHKDSLISTTVLTYINLVAYIIDLAYSTKLVFFTTQ
ncbi:myeloid-associated differentiation marker homolog [Protopterus annectens]|uniref:myeloid-associated differentiation marker homolog n=1 Tax=Protopterus annectens TaxID=7888 RepID=UPI001CFA460E|nr:myeloid-associated differentiation marker homolog [Protopterus annectens]